MSEVKKKAYLAKEASHKLASITTEQKNNALTAIADALVLNKESIIEANKIDLMNGKQNGLSKSLQDRLALSTDRIIAIADGLRQIVDLKDPIGKTIEEIRPINGLYIKKITVPIGLIGMIYEARPNVTVDAAGLCLKSGNAVILRGGTSALSSNIRIVEIMHDVLDKTDIPKDVIQLISNPDRSSVNEMLTLNGLVDVVIPRGGASLIQNVIQNATVPVIETGAGICHTYIDKEANLTMATNIALNAKIQRPSVCNAMETLLLHKQFAETHFPQLANLYREENVDLKGCAKAKQLAPWINDATEDDYNTEYNDYTLNIKIVEHIEEALIHIKTYGTHHSECIVTENSQNAELFLHAVDAAAVYHNASTRFTDGFEFGFGAEIGISTQKLHVRGPMGLEALTSTKYRIHGTGQTKK
ncbi:glutamate-5-semialdehyde dehydrogenase [Cytobacillus sp. IB215665]|uniref:glutamate-5-semialdehyde dehydrogenase n=1 Tax=Cytobacillus sp. IB215665 TaxID=3097357 RepID=UPI002A0D036A|nr:glutamate-5-semialdehyde dehydrogenase [Cytobacillus sp. IB215665]MDX8366652.1 glutamate-5-semialdehyde dehydrogenase [Cytobacillus sp. IB215665]